MLYLHAIIVDKSVGLAEAKKIARKTFEKRVNTFRDQETSYAFRNIPKNKFKPDTFAKKKLNDKVTLVVGELKDFVETE